MGLLDLESKLISDEYLSSIHDCVEIGASMYRIFINVKVSKDLEGGYFWIPYEHTETMLRHPYGWIIISKSQGNYHVWTHLVDFYSGDLHKFYGTNPTQEEMSVLISALDHKCKTTLFPNF